MSASPSCPACGKIRWKTSYNGPIRDGAFGNLTDDKARVHRCSCGLERLDPAYCRDESIYCGTDYRELLHQGTSAEEAFADNDHLQLQNLSPMWPLPLRGRTVADVGCGAGSFLDHVCGLAERTVAIEPCAAYHDSLAGRGHTVFHGLEQAGKELAGKVDTVFSFAVIEHVPDPLGYLQGIAALLRPGGIAILSTPNRKDILLTLLGDVFKSFFYRTVHRWYFDDESLNALGRRAGLDVAQCLCVQRFGISNTLQWLRDSRPKGDTPLPLLDDAILNDTWKRSLEAKGVGDFLYIKLQAPN